MEFLTAPSILSTSFQELMTMLAAALGCGLLIGLERERSKHNEANHHFAGVRTFAVCALLGAICFLLGPVFGIVGAVIIGGVGLFSLKNQVEDPGATTELAFIMTYFIGAICLWNIPLAAGLAVLITIILMAKHSMHNIAGQWITEAEFRDGLLLLALILIGLPLTPDRPLWGEVLNPYLILKLVTLILVVQALAHIAKRFFSTKNALILSSIASGFVSSTATIAQLGIQVRKGEMDAKSNAGAALMSCISTLVLLFIVVGGVSWDWLKILLLPSLVAMLILAACAFVLLHKAEPAKNQESPESSDSKMFSLKEAVIIAAALTLIQAGVYGLEILLGNAGLLAGTLFASLFEIHAAMASVVIQGDPSNTRLIYALLLGLGAHAVAKSVNAAVTGGFKFSLYFAPVQILHMAVLIGILWWMVF
ncbi:MgtC/SapB family protein [Acinetobacter indicus]|uniref:MgtC/SapB family protein n=1 Tax=Acinetobacter TaxID=469 RepID=UPI001444781C|nr:MULTISPECIES: MgtC/SapB family protein [Acinetobacter]MCP0915989.1 MgtC/SapB family protein [Acinetobacter indicus]MCP0919115.1 MgtC/SapB family protein [Acinetobacter indicus]MCP0921781.1 MgtC/SapB family protein [Acinetobacter indicus]QSQ93863.1 MgtC/SapB family protein [Acinetobacter indicus]